MLRETTGLLRDVADKLNRQAAPAPSSAPIADASMQQLVAPVRTVSISVNSLRILTQSLNEVRVAVEKLAALLPVLTAAEGALQNVIAAGP